MQRMVEDLIDRAILNHTPCVHHRHDIRVLRHHAQIVRDEHDRHAVLVLKSAQQFENLGLYGHVQGRGRLVSQQQARFAGQGHGDHHPLAHPAGKLMGILIQPAARLGDAHAAQGLLGNLDRFAARHLLMQQDRFEDLLADGVDGIERGHRLLKDHGDLIAANLLHLPVGQIEQCPAVKHDLAALIAAGRDGDELEDGQGRDRLAAAAFADHRQRLLRIDGQSHAVHSAHRP